MSVSVCHLEFMTLGVSPELSEAHSRQGSKLVGGGGVPSHPLLNPVALGKLFRVFWDSNLTKSWQSEPCVGPEIAVLFSC